MFKKLVFLTIASIALSNCSASSGEKTTILNPGDAALPTQRSTEPAEQPTPAESTLEEESGTAVVEDSTAIPTDTSETAEESVSDDSSSPLPERSDVSGLALYCWQNPDYCVGIGDPNAPVILVEISDYFCGHCRNFNLETAPELDREYIEKGDLYWLVLPYALAMERIPSTNSALCAAEQGSFAEYHHRMFEIYGDADARTPDGFYRLAGELGLELESFRECVESEKYRGVVEQNMALAAAVGVNSTPTFVIGEQALVGNYPLEAFREWIAAELGE